MNKSSPACDLCIVGGGILGIMTAYRAATIQPQKQIIAIDRNQFGHGATRYAAALSSTLASTPMVAELACESDLFYRHLVQDDPGLAIRSLAIVYVLNRACADLLKTTRQPIEVEFDEVKADLPLSRPSSEYVILKSHGALHIDSLAIVRALVKKLKSLPNVLTIENKTVVDVRTSTETIGKKLQIETERGPVLRSNQALLSLGPWSRSHSLCQRNLRLGDRIKKIVSMHLEIPPSSNCPVIFFPQEDAFLLPDRDRFIFSIHSEEWDVDPDRLLDISEADRRRGREILERYAPHLLTHYEDGKVFCDCYSSDSNPIIQRHEEIEGVVIAAGGHGRGVRLAPAIARKALQLLNWAPQQSVRTA